ncbi:MAG: methyltransferase domain-containing protein [Saprospirales bacterium]|nr:methyltransferase domain-containing protein [Saprospirales bacterium]
MSGIQSLLTAHCSLLTESMSLHQLIEYYEKTTFDYSVAWLTRENPAIHFGYYDEQARVHKEALLRLNEVMADWAGISAGTQVLDAGCGLGAGTIWLAKARKAQATGISPVPDQINKARGRAREERLTDLVQFEEADYHQTPFPAQSFDVVWACESLCHSPAKHAFYQEAFRLLRPGGKLVIAEYIRSGRPLSDRQEFLLTDWLQGWVIPDIDTREEHQSYARLAGFSELTIRDITSHTRVSHRNLYHQARRWWWLGQILAAIRVRTPVQHGNHRGAFRQYEALEENAWFYGLGLAEKPVSPKYCTLEPEEKAIKND